MCIQRPKKLKLKTFHKAGIVYNGGTSCDGIYEMYSKEWTNKLLKKRVIRGLISPCAEQRLAL